MPRITKEQERAMFAFCTFVHDHHPAEFQHLLRFGTATDKLIELGQDTKTGHVPPFSLASSRGVKSAAKTAKLVRAWKNDIPYMAFLLREDMQKVALADRKSKVQMSALVELICTRSAIIRNPDVMLSFESIQVGVKALTGEMIGMDTIRRMLQRLDHHVDGVKVEFGKRGVFTKTTKVKLTFVTHSDQIREMAEENKRLVEDWLSEYGHWIVRVQQHEARLKNTLAERKAEWAAKHGIHLDVEGYIRANTVTVGKRRYVNWPGEDQGSLLVLDCVGVEVGPVDPGAPIVTRDWQAPDLQLQKFDVPKIQPPAPALKPKPVPWWKRKRELEQRGATSQEILLDGLDLTVPKDELPAKPTWKAKKREVEQASLDRLRQRLAEKGIPYDA